MYMKMNMITKIKEHVRFLEKGEENPQPFLIILKIQIQKAFSIFYVDQSEPR